MTKPREPSEIRQIPDIQTIPIEQVLNVLQAQLEVLKNITTTVYYWGTEKEL